VLLGFVGLVALVAFFSTGWLAKLLAVLANGA
jgi:hypothetical protein